MRRSAKLALALGTCFALAGGAYVAYVEQEGRDIHGSATVEFSTSESPTTPTTPTTHSQAHAPGVAWATYGFDAARLHDARGLHLRPPFRRIWTFHGRALLEFPPAVAYGLVYLPTFDGRLYALAAASGRVIWRFRSDKCAWASPAVADGLVFQTFLLKARQCAPVAGPHAGELVALDAHSGRVRWRRQLAATETSPLVANGLVYVGDWSGRLSAADEMSGRMRWSRQIGGELKSSPALWAGRIYTGSYDGHLSAVDARTGTLLWRAAIQARLGGLGRIYSTPAVAYGRVYVGSTDGKVYSFGARSGKLRWSHSTGGYVYAAPAVWHRRVLVGSYDHRFYALDAATGAEDWQFVANGPISGAATVLSGLVYFSTFAKRTYALDASSGRLVWSYPDGKYSPVVSDGDRLYLVGYGRLYGLVERARGRR